MMEGRRARTRCAHAASLWLLSCLGHAAAPQGEGEATAGPDSPPAAGAPAEALETAPAVPEGRTPAYRDQREADELYSSWLGTGLCEALELGESVGGRPLFGVQFGGWGQTPLAERTTVLLVGGLDGRSLSGSEAVLFAVDALLATPDRLPDDITFIALPWANPDGLARTLEEGCGDGHNDRLLDDDGDGVADEDGPDDLDGDGMILELLVEDPDGEWVRGAEGRFLRRALAGEAPRYRRTLEGRDDDGDGRYNEDGPGGIALERNFPVGWRGPLVDPTAGSWPLSEPAARALATLALERRTAAALVFQGNHGGLVVPAPAVLDGERERLGAAYATLDELFADATGRTVATAERPPAGAAIDWLSASLGALAAEVAVWGPWVETAGPEMVDARYVPSGTGEPDELLVPLRSGLASIDQSWARWLDDTRGGLGHVDWQPVDLGDGRQGLVGGWEPRTCFNPPLGAIARSVEGVDRFVLEVARALPRLEVELLEARREGELCVVRARLRNGGRLPSGLQGEGPDGRLVFTLEVPEGVSVLAGSMRHELAHIPGQGATDELSWLFVAPEGSVFAFRLEAPWCPTLVREVRL